MNSALKKMGELPGPVSAIATGHGPMLVENKDSWIEKYKSWSEEVTKKMGPPGAHLLGQPAWRGQRLAQAMATDSPGRTSAWRCMT